MPRPKNTRWRLSSDSNSRQFRVAPGPGAFWRMPALLTCNATEFPKNWLSCAAWIGASLICTEWAKNLRKYNSQNIWFQAKLTTRLFIPAALQAATKTSCCRIHLPPRGPKILVLAEKSWVRGPHRHSDDQNEPDQTFHVYESQVSDEMSTWVLKISRFWLSSVSSCYRIRRKYLEQVFSSVESLQTLRYNKFWLNQGYGWSAKENTPHLNRNYYRSTVLLYK